MAFDAYKNEKAVLDHADTLLGLPEGVDFEDEYRALYKSYAKLYKLLRRLMTISDRMEKHLKQANQTIDAQRRALTAAHDDLASRNIELETKSNAFESIFNNSALGIAQLAPDGSFERANQRLCELLDVPPEALRGHRLQDYLFDLGSGQGDEVGLGCPEPGEILQLERRIKTGTGRVFFAELSGKALNPACPKAGVIWIVDDITSRKDLEKLHADVQRIMQHDLKGPLNGIINLPDIVAQSDNLNPEQIELLDHIASSGRRMLRQIELSQDIYNMETGRYVFEAKPVDFVAVVRTVLQEYQILAERSGVTLLAMHGARAIRPEDRLVGAADELLSCVMLGNIVKNAIEASQHGETVRICLEGAAGITLEVHNQQPVPPHVLPYFFNKYVTFGKTGGTGLGTYSAFLMAKTQACGLEVVSSETEGTRVTFTIPRYCVVRQAQATQVGDLPNRRA